MKSTIEAWPYIIVGEEFAEMNKQFILVYHEDMVIDVSHYNLSLIHPLWNYDHENKKSSLRENMKTCNIV